MASGIEFEEDSENKGSMWVLDQKLDQPMDEEAGRLKNMYREKVTLLPFLKNFLFFFYVGKTLAVFFWSWAALILDKISSPIPNLEVLITKALEFSIACRGIEFVVLVT